jgi:hypothetical protein
MFLDELLRHDGRGDSLNQSSCFVCKKQDGIIYKCEDCTDGALLKCQSCTVLEHCSQPFHRVKVRDFIYITQTSSDDLLVLEWTFFRQDFTSKFRTVCSTRPFRRNLPVSRTRPSTIHCVHIEWYSSNQHRLLWMPSSPSVKNGANPSPGVVPSYFHSTANSIHV